jgi:response regulator RpfG family c-di-GMP phosphodiesterase
MGHTLLSNCLQMEINMTNKTITILYVDDEDINLFIFKRALKLITMQLLQIQVRKILIN